MTQQAWGNYTNTTPWHDFIDYKRRLGSYVFILQKQKRNMADACDSVALPGGDIAPPTSSLFQCKQAVNPQMRRIVDHHQTFVESENWPSERIEADPTLLANAGFYCIGDGDWVKCWYCNDGLKNWDRFDDPWIDYAKWFSLCEYLLKKKGVNLVKDIVKG